MIINVICIKGTQPIKSYFMKMYHGYVKWDNVKDKKSFYIRWQIWFGFKSFWLTGNTDLVLMAAMTFFILLYNFNDCILCWLMA